MYTPAHFSEPRLEVLHALVASHPLATVVATVHKGIVANHIPLLLTADHGASGTLRGHIARANPMWQEITSGTEVLAIFQGGNHYISPGWYPSKQEHGRVVPTWNYAVVHARGPIEWYEDDARLQQLLHDLTSAHEARLAAPWQIADAPADYIAKMRAAIVGFEIPIRQLTGKFKLSQNRSAQDRDGVATALSRLTDDPAAIAMARTLRPPAR